MKIKQLFQGERVAGLLGTTNCGKTNNLVHLILDFRRYSQSQIVVYGFNDKVSAFLVEKAGVVVVASLRELSLIRDSLIVMDEFQRLRIGDRRYRELTDEFFDFIYHNNNWVLLCSPNMACFTKDVCRKVDVFCFKEVYLPDLVNGSDAKVKLDGYAGSRMVLDRLVVGKGEILVLGVVCLFVSCDYVEEVDFKLGNLDIFCQSKLSKKKVKEKDERGIS